MKFQLKEIRIPESWRSDSGPLSGLKETIKTPGLPPQVGVREIRNEKGWNYEFIAGYRRWRAVEELGGEEIAVTILSPKDHPDLKSFFRAFDGCQKQTRHRRVWSYLQ